MHFKVLACNVFFREFCYSAANSPATISVEFFELGEHARPEKLRKHLQDKIDAVAAGPATYDAVILLYGLCGRALDGLVARREKLVAVRAHDCCTLLLGSKEKFKAEFEEMPSTPFSSVGFVERGNYFFEEGEMMQGDAYADLVEKYGEENAKYIYDSMHPKLDGKLQPVYFIDIPEIKSQEAMAICRSRSAADGREFKTLPGSLRLIKKLVSGEWPAEEFLTVEPGKRIALVGDWDKIIKVMDA